MPSWLLQWATAVGTAHHGAQVFDHGRQIACHWLCAQMMAYSVETIVSISMLLRAENNASTWMIWGEL